MSQLCRSMELCVNGSCGDAVTMHIKAQHEVCLAARDSVTVASSFLTAAQAAYYTALFAKKSPSATDQSSNSTGTAASVQLDGLSQLVCKLQALVDEAAANAKFAAVALQQAIELRSQVASIAVYAAEYAAKAVTCQVAVQQLLAQQSQRTTNANKPEPCSPAQPTDHTYTQDDHPICSPPATPLARPSERPANASTPQHAHRMCLQHESHALNTTAPTQTAACSNAYRVNLHSVPAATPDDDVVLDDHDFNVESDQEPVTTEHIKHQQCAGAGGGGRSRRGSSKRTRKQSGDSDDDDDPGHDDDGDDDDYSPGRGNNNKGSDDGDDDGDDDKHQAGGYDTEEFVVSDEDEDDDEDDDKDSDDNDQPKRKSKTKSSGKKKAVKTAKRTSKKVKKSPAAAKAKSTPRSSTKGRSRGKKADNLDGFVVSCTDEDEDIDDDDEEDVEEQQEAARKTPAKKGRSQAGLSQSKKAIQHAKAKSAAGGTRASRRSRTRQNWAHLNNDDDDGGSSEDGDQGQQPADHVDQQESSSDLEILTSDDPQEEEEDEGAEAAKPLKDDKHKAGDTSRRSARRTALVISSDDEDKAPPPQKTRRAGKKPAAAAPDASIDLTEDSPDNPVTQQQQQQGDRQRQGQGKQQPQRAGWNCLLNAMSKGKKGLKEWSESDDDSPSNEEGAGRQQGRQQLDDADEEVLVPEDVATGGNKQGKKRLRATAPQENAQQEQQQPQQDDDGDDEDGTNLVAARNNKRRRKSGRRISDDGDEEDIAMAEVAKRNQDAQDEATPTKRKSSRVPRESKQFKKRKEILAELADLHDQGPGTGSAVKKKKLDSMSQKVQASAKKHRLDRSKSMAVTGGDAPGQQDGSGEGLEDKDVELQDQQEEQQEEEDLGELYKPRFGDPGYEASDVEDDSDEEEFVGAGRREATQRKGRRGGNDSDGDGNGNGGQQAAQGDDGEDSDMGDFIVSDDDEGAEAAQQAMMQMQVVSRGATDAKQRFKDWMLYLLLKITHLDLDEDEGGGKGYLQPHLVGANNYFTAELKDAFTAVFVAHWVTSAKQTGLSENIKKFPGLVVSSRPVHYVDKDELLFDSGLTYADIDNETEPDLHFDKHFHKYMNRNKKGHKHHDDDDEEVDNDVNDGYGRGNVGSRTRGKATFREEVDEEGRISVWHAEDPMTCCFCNKTRYHNMYAVRFTKTPFGEPAPPAGEHSKAREVKYFGGGRCLHRLILLHALSHFTHRLTARFTRDIRRMIDTGEAGDYSEAVQRMMDDKAELRHVREVYGDLKEAANKLTKNESKRSKSHEATAGIVEAVDRVFALHSDFEAREQSLEPESDEGEEDDDQDEQGDDGEEEEEEEDDGGADQGGQRAGDGGGNAQPQGRGQGGNQASQSQQGKQQPSSTTKQPKPNKEKSQGNKQSVAHVNLIDDEEEEEGLQAGKQAQHAGDADGQEDGEDGGGGGPSQGRRTRRAVVLSDTDDDDDDVNEGDGNKRGTPVNAKITPQKSQQRQQAQRKILQRSGSDTGDSDVDVKGTSKQQGTGPRSPATAFATRSRQSTAKKQQNAENKRGKDSGRASNGAKPFSITDFFATAGPSGSLSQGGSQAAASALKQAKLPESFRLKWTPKASTPAAAEEDKVDDGRQGGTHDHARATAATKAGKVAPKQQQLVVDLCEDDD